MTLPVLSISVQLSNADRPGRNILKALDSLPPLPSHVHDTIAVKELDPDTTKCPGSSDPFYIVSYYIKWITTTLVTQY